MTKVFLTMLTLLLIFCTFSSASAQTLEAGEGCKYPTIQDAINAAGTGDKIIIHPGTYSIDFSIIPKSNLEIAGAGINKTIIYTDSFKDCSSNSNPGLIYLNALSNVYIHDLTIQGAAKSQEDQHQNGGTSSIGGLREARNGIRISGSENITISKCKFSLLLSDGIRITSSENVRISNCIINAGHDSISAYNSRDVNANNCNFDLMINTCFRFYNVESCTLSNSTFQQTYRGSGAGYIELEGFVRSTKIYNNIFLSSSDPVIFLASPKGGNVNIENNILSGVRGLSLSYMPFYVSQKNNTLYFQAAAPAVVQAATPAVVQAATPAVVQAANTDTYTALIRESQAYKEKGESLLSGSYNDRVIGYQYIKISQSKYANAQTYKQTQTGWDNGVL